MDLFGAAYEWGGGGGQKGSPSIKSVTHILHWDGNWHSYNLPKEDPKNA